MYLYLCSRKCGAAHIHGACLPWSVYWRVASLARCCRAVQGTGCVHATFAADDVGRIGQMSQCAMVPLVTVEGDQIDWPEASI